MFRCANHKPERIRKDAMIARMTINRRVGIRALACAAFAAADEVSAQQAAGPPAVGVIAAAKRPFTESNEFLGRIEATNRVNVVARVTAFLEKRSFAEGAEVKAG